MNRFIFLCFLTFISLNTLAQQRNLSPDAEATQFIDSLKHAGVDTLMHYYYQEGTYGWGGGKAVSTIVWKERGKYYSQMIDNISYFTPDRYGYWHEPFEYYFLNASAIQNELPAESWTLKKFFESDVTTGTDSSGKVQKVFYHAPSPDEVTEYQIEIVTGSAVIRRRISGNHFWSVANPVEYLKNYDLKFYVLMKMIEGHAEARMPGRVLK